MITTAENMKTIREKIWKCQPRSATTKVKLPSEREILVLHGKMTTATTMEKIVAKIWKYHYVGLSLAWSNSLQSQVDETFIQRKLELMLRLRGRFQFVDVEMGWSLRNDPTSPSLVKMQFHQHIHPESGSIRRDLPSKHRSPAFPVEVLVQLKTNRNCKDHFLHNLSHEWYSSSADEKHADRPKPR